MKEWSVEFDMNGGLVVEAETAEEAERLARSALIRWDGSGTFYEAEVCTVSTPSVLPAEEVR